MNTFKGFEVVAAGPYIGLEEQKDSEGRVVPKPELVFFLDVDGENTYIQTMPTDLGGGEKKIVRLAALKTRLVLKILMEEDVARRLVAWQEQERS